MLLRNEVSSLSQHIYVIPELSGLHEAGPNSKSNECYLGLLYTMEDVAVYGYVTPLKVKIVLSLGLTDSVIRDADITMVRFYSHVAVQPSH